MMNIFLRARSFDPANWKKGYEVNFPIADGNGTDPAKLKFLGRKVVKADNGVKYNCLQLSYVEKEHGKWREIARFYVTDDSNHVPVSQVWLCQSLSYRHERLEKQCGFHCKIEAKGLDLWISSE